MSSQYYLVSDLLLYCAYYSIAFTVHSINVVPRLIRDKSLPINLTKMTVKMNKKFRTNIVYVF